MAGPLSLPKGDRSFNSHIIRQDHAILAQRARAQETIQMQRVKYEELQKQIAAEKASAHPNLQYIAKAEQICKEMYKTFTKGCR